MNNILRNVLAVIAGLIVGGIVNILLVMAGGALIPPPAGVDMTDLESIKASMHLFETKHFVFPFLAHAVGTLTSALIASLIAGSSRLLLAMIIGVLGLIGGIVAVLMFPAPAWFDALDLIAAYIPMAWLGWKLSGRS